MCLLRQALTSARTGFEVIDMEWMPLHIHDHMQVLELYGCRGFTCVSPTAVAHSQCRTASLTLSYLYAAIYRLQGRKHTHWCRCFISHDVHITCSQSGHTSILMSISTLSHPQQFHMTTTCGFFRCSLILLELILGLYASDSSQLIMSVPECIVKVFYVKKICQNIRSS
jgi:hypothetical protein